MWQNIRIGQGYDVHRLVAERPLILGGVTLDHPLGLLGHSDADVLLHATIDALLGAAALGDIGQHFSDRDPQYAGADSAVLLSEAYRKVQKLGWSLINLDATLIAQAPKLGPHLPSMRQCMAELLAVDVGSLNLKAKTNEGLGYLGRSEAIEAQVVCLLAQKT